MAIIARREFIAYFLSPIAYVYIITFLVLSTWLFFRMFFVEAQAHMRGFFGLMPWVFLFFIPAVSMGKWAEERKQGTLEILFTMPVSDYAIIIAKFAASIALVGVALLMTVSIPLTISTMGNLDWGPVIGGYIGLLFMGSAFLSVGLMISSMTENQIIAFILSIVACFFLMILGSPMLLGNSSHVIAQFLHYIGLGSHFSSIARGVIDTRDLIYYLSVIVVFLFINQKILMTRARR